LNIALDSGLLDQLALSRRVADYAASLGFVGPREPVRSSCDHLGAVLADAILQAGLNYRSVVLTRVERILRDFPDAATMPGLLSLIAESGAGYFLLWNHNIKTERFVALVTFLSDEGIRSTSELRSWLSHRDSRNHLLGLHGVGPKTFDYLCCLVGIDCVAVDRHVRLFACEAGISVSEYDQLKAIISHAADLLGARRRDFDAWIWQTISSRSTGSAQLQAAIGKKS
jgi:hypothetical protein